MYNIFCSGAYLYRKEQKKRLRHMSSSSNSTETKLRCRGSSEDGSSCSTGRDYIDDTRMSEGMFFFVFWKCKPLTGFVVLISNTHTHTVHSPQPLTTTTAASSTMPASAAAAAAATSLNATSSAATGDHQQHQHHHHNDTESCSSSVESTAEEDRVFLQLGDQLKSALEHDWTMITKHERLVNLPAKICVITILENFVKHYSVRAISCPTQIDGSRRRNSSAKVEKREKDYEKLNNSINLRKEVADGLRIYFDFTLRDYLLYRQEREQANSLLSDENLRHFTYVASERQSVDLFTTFKSSESADDLQPAAATAANTIPNSSSSSSNNPTVATEGTEEGGGGGGGSISSLSAKRRLRSYKTEENEFIFDLSGAATAAGGKDGISSVASTSSGSSTPQAHQFQAHMHILKSIIPPNMSVNVKAKEMLQSILAWQMLPSNAPPQPSMIYGAVHLARLIGE